MKQFTCREMGGPCDVVIEGNTAEEIAQKGAEHIMNAEDEIHEEMKQQMNASNPEEKEKWMEDFRMKFDQKEEM